MRQLLGFNGHSYRSRSFLAHAITNTHQYLENYSSLGPISASLWLINIYYHREMIQYFY